MRRSDWFFGRRKSKALSDRQQKRFEALYPQIGIDISRPSVQHPAALFSHNPDFVVLEIGFGGGEHLVHAAQSSPATGYIGVEPFVNSMAKALKQIEDNNIQNIRLFDEDAAELLDWLPASCLDRIDLFYPDPWPKLRHWKRRFVNQENLDRFSRVLKRGAMFRFASDIESYVNWTIQHCDRHQEFEWLAKKAADWRRPYPGWIQTRYEAKAVREGRTPAYLGFRKIQ